MWFRLGHRQYFQQYKIKDLQGFLQRPFWQAARWVADPMMEHCESSIQEDGETASHR
jgi:hypothetical protein